MRNSYLLLGFFLLGNAAFSQDKIKDGTITPSSNIPKDGALLDLESNNRALLLTRVSLSSTTVWGLNGVAPAEGGYTVYNSNISITGTTAYPIIEGGAGVYYWDGVGWVATKQNVSYTEPWNIQGTTNPARLNSQNIYQSGTVAIGLNQVYSGATLHVQGAIRGGANPQGDVGGNSIALGTLNEASGANSIALGYENQAAGGSSFAVGYQSKATGQRSMALGDGNTASGANSTAFGNGTQALAIRATSFGLNTIVRADATNGTAFGNASVAAGTNSTAFGASTVASGDRSTAFGNATSASGPSSTAFGFSTIASEMRSTAFGYDTRASGNTSTAFGGETVASELYATAFGYQSRAVGGTSTAFGSASVARGARSIAAGNDAQTSATASDAISLGNSTSANHSNALVLGNNVTSSSDNQLTARFQGGYRFMTQAQSVSNIGAKLDNGANAWSVMSSKALKENFQLVDGKQVLAKIINLELSSWNYIGQEKETFRHYGPMAEDFYEAFGNDGIGTVGNSDSINQADFDGINMIAIQALAKENQELKARIERLEKLLLDKK